jgi:hypothetical protein
MSAWSIAWIAWALAFVGIEGAALMRKDRPGRPATLSAHVWWLVRGTGTWHQLARAALVFGLGWLTHHLLAGP